MTEGTLPRGETGAPVKGILSNAAKWAVRITIGVAVLWLLLVVFRLEAIHWIYSYIALQLSVNVDLDDQVATLLAAVLTALSIPLIPYVTAFLLRGQQSGAVTAIVLIVVVAAFGLLFAFGGEVFFTKEGRALRCWAMTPAGIKIVSRPAELMSCPIERTYNIQTHPMESDIVPSVLAARKGVKPTPISSEDVRGDYFDTATGKPKVWFKANKNQTFDLFNGPGFHPKTQLPLEPATQKNVEAIEKYVTLEAQRSERRVAKEKADQESALKLGEALLASGVKTKNLIAKPGRLEKVPLIPPNHKYRLSCLSGVKFEVSAKGGNTEPYDCGQITTLPELDNADIWFTSNTKNEYLITLEYWPVGTNPPKSRYATH